MLNLTKTDLELTRAALNLQIKEFELQRTELEGTKIALEEQSKTQELQRFETTFFNLLGFHNQVIRNLNIRADTQGYDYLSSLYGRYFKAHILVKNVKTTINYSCKKNYIDIIPYFEYVENLFLYIWNSSSIVNKQFYANLFIAQLTDERIGLILTYCTQNKDFKDLIYNINSLNNRFQKFGLFNDLYEISHDISSSEPILD